MSDRAYAFARTLEDRSPHDVALVHGDRSWNFRQLDEHAGRAAGLLRDAGITAGDRVAVLATNGLPMVAAMLGAARIGAVVVPMNWRLLPREIEEIVDDARPRFLFVESSLCDRITLHRDHAVLPDRSDLDQDLPWSTSPWLVCEADYPAEAVCIQVYTSGTSGRPKGVLLTNANLACKVTGTASIWELTPSSRTLLSTPLFHVGGLSWLLAALATGATTVFADSTRAEDLLHHLGDDAISHAFLVPTQVRAVCDGAAPGTSFPCLRAVYYGAAPMDQELREQAEVLFGPTLHHLYGLSETTGAITELPPHSRLEGSAGQPYPWVELQIRDVNDGRVLPAGVYGEVWVRSDQNCAGYFEQPAATAALFDEHGWLRTGDGGYQDSDGNLYLTDRVKDMIITGGENVFPREVEDALRTHPAVADVAVVGVADRYWGQRVAAAIVPLPGQTIDERDVMAYIRQHLAAYKCPTIIREFAELPRNPTGKVLRRIIREEMSSEPSMR